MRYDKALSQRNGNDPIYRAREDQEIPDPHHNTCMLVFLQTGSFQPLPEASDAPLDTPRGKKTARRETQTDGTQL
jgi:hypothetical protein